MNHYHRRSIRMKGHDYGQECAYFITLCTQNRECLFDQYPVLKTIVFNQWNHIPARFQNVKLDEFVIMPNHIHGIINLVGATLAVARNENDAVARNENDAVAQNGITEHHNTRATARVAPTIGLIIGQFKSLCVNEWLIHIKQNNSNIVGKFWQRNYYEHIIRNECELNRIRKYIRNNPLNLKEDRNTSYLQK